MNTAQYSASSAYRYGYPDPSTNALAIVSLVTSLVGVHLVGIITGHIALGQISRRGQRGAGLAIAGLVIGYVGILLTLLVLAAIAVLLGQQNDARDSAVQSDITNLKVALITATVTNPSAGLPAMTDPRIQEVFVPSPDSVLAVFGDQHAFCVQGHSLAGGPARSYAATSVSGTVEGTCTAAGLLVPAAP